MHTHFPHAHTFLFLTMDDWFIPGHSVDQERRGADVVQQRRGRPDGSSKCVVHSYSCSVTSVLAVFGLQVLIHRKHDHFMTVMHNLDL